MFRVLNALDLVHFIMGHHKLVQPNMGGRARARVAAAPHAPHLEPPMHVSYATLHICCLLILFYHPAVLCCPVIYSSVDCLLIYLRVFLVFALICFKLNNNC